MNDTQNDREFVKQGDISYPDDIPYASPKFILADPDDSDIHYPSLSDSDDTDDSDDSDISMSDEQRDMTFQEEQRLNAMLPWYQKQK